MSSLTFVYGLTWTAAALLVPVSLAGLVYGPRGLYDNDPRTLPTFLGQDLITLTVGVPFLLVAALKALRGSNKALLCWMGALFYIAYAYYFYVVGARFSPLYPAYIVIVSIGMYGVLALLFALDVNRLARHVDPDAPVRTISAFLIITSLFFSALWLALIVRHLLSGTALDAVSRAVIAVDGVVLLPLLFFGGLWLRRREPLGVALAGLLLVKIVATFLTLVANTAIGSAWGQRPDLLQTTAFAVGLAVGLGLLVRYLRCVDDRI